MAGLAGLRSGVHKLVSRLTPTMARTQRSPMVLQRRRVNTSGTQKSETVSSTATTECKPPKKYWVSYGFSYVDEELDKHMMHVTLFVTISLFLVGGSYILIYLPDFRMKDWAQREAYIELRRRESLGLPAVDPNLIDPAKVKLPTDEELGNTEIII